MKRILSILALLGMSLQINAVRFTAAEEQALTKVFAPSERIAQLEAQLAELNATTDAFLGWLIVAMSLYGSIKLYQFMTSKRKQVNYRTIFATKNSLFERGWPSLQSDNFLADQQEGFNKFLAKYSK